MSVTHQWCCWVVVCLNAAESCSTGNIQLLLLLNTAAYWVSWSVVNSVCYICDLQVFSAVTLLCFWVMMCLLSSARGLNPLVLRPHCGEAAGVPVVQCSRAEPSGAASSLRWSRCCVCLSSARGLNPLVLRPHCGEAVVVSVRPVLEGWTSGAASSLRWSCCRVCLSSARGLNPLVLRPHCGEAAVVTVRPVLEGWTLWCCVLTAVKLLLCLSVQCSRAEPSGTASSLRWSWTSSSSCVRLHDWAEHQPWLAVTQGRTPVSLLWSSSSVLDVSLLFQKPNIVH